jgi:hypothetical protein
MWNYFFLNSILNFSHSTLCHAMRQSSFCLCQSGFQFWSDFKVTFLDWISSHPSKLRHSSQCVVLHANSSVGQHSLPPYVLQPNGDSPMPGHAHHVWPHQNSQRSGDTETANHLHPATHGSPRMAPDISGEYCERSRCMYANAEESSDTWSFTFPMWFDKPSPKKSNLKADFFS